MRWTSAIAVLAALGVQCGSIDEDATATAADRAGPDAIDCGFADGNAFENAPTAADVRACMRTALERKQAFYASASPASADGGTVIAFASDGHTLWRVRHDYAIAIGFGCDSETLDERPCDRFRDYGAGCSTVASDLCFECE